MMLTPQRVLLTFCIIQITQKSVLEHITKPQPASCLDSSVPLVRKCRAQVLNRRHYDPAASSLHSSSAPSLQTAKLEERREGSHLRAGVQFVAVAGIRISFQLLTKNSKNFFWSLYPLLLQKEIPPLVALSPLGSISLFFENTSKSVFLSMRKQDLTTVMSLTAFWHTFRLPLPTSASRSRGQTVQSCYRDDFVWKSSRINFSFKHGPDWSWRRRPCVPREEGVDSQRTHTLDLRTVNPLPTHCQSTPCVSDLFSDLICGFTRCVICVDFAVS